MRKNVSLYFINFHVRVENLDIDFLLTRINSIERIIIFAFLNFVHICRSFSKAEIFHQSLRPSHPPLLFRSVTSAAWVRIAARFLVHFCTFLIY